MHTRNNESPTMTSAELFDLYLNHDELKKALEANPALINEQDECGRTLLHLCAAGDGIYSGTVIKLLLSINCADFSIKDAEGNTPMHIAAYNANHREAYDNIYPMFVKECTRKNFDFNMLNERGLAVIHIATIIKFELEVGCYNFSRSCLGLLLDIAPDIDLNVLSSSGSTAFFYAIAHGKIDDATRLFDAGADPSLFGANEDRNPLVLLERIHHGNEAILNMMKETDKNKQFLIMRSNKIVFNKMYMEYCDEKLDYEDEDNLEEFVNIIQKSQLRIKEKIQPWEDLREKVLARMTASNKIGMDVFSIWKSPRDIQEQTSAPSHHATPRLTA